ncbi:class III extradiol ring-cleavage dioxygenase family protein [Enterobacter asburiae]|uniref:hypothetical protein n=1 Tax=Enterobacter asburiae TaxID=61645 RepID=UPI00192A867B|nr:hypothetical protein [Enterobacter asburiae]MBL5924702.1 hypothetical protein [Enterobacter asburiae]MBL5955489.1 hypothetical protein [Enterobacter asburiae]
MAKVHEELSAGIRFGGTIDPSWTTSIAGVKKGIEALGKESSDLIKQQEKLKTKRLQAAMKGDVEQVRKLNEEHAALSQRIKGTIAEEEKLSKVLKRREQMERFKGRVSSGMSAAGRGAKAGLKWGALGAAGGITGLAAGAVAINAETMEKIGLARSYGIDAENYLAMGKMAKGAGLNDENVGDLFEEYKNKLNDYRDNEMKKGDLYDVLTELGFKAHELAGMNNEQQATEILDRLSRMKDSQKAAALADKAFGGEGNKLVTWLQSTGKVFSELRDNEKQYIMLSKEGMAEAEKGQKALSDLWMVAQTAAMEITGMTLGSLSGYIQEATKSFADWFKSGGAESITDFIREKLIPGFAWLAKATFTISKAIYMAAKKFLGWVMDDEGEIASNKQDILRQTAVGNNAVAAGMAKDLGLEDWYNSKVNNVETQSQLRRAWQQGGKPEEREARIRGVVQEDMSIEQQISNMETAAKSFLSPPPQQKPSEYDLSAPATAYGYGNLPEFDLSSVVASTQGVSPRKQVHNEVKPTINVYQMPGEDANALAQRTAQEVIKPFESGMFDPPEVM